MSWTEDEYVEYLAGERRRFAWTMHRYGELTPIEAENAALERYPYESPHTPYRGLIFHDEAWQWALLEIYGEDYPRTHPELVTPPAEYGALD
ncbi:hypothetical protein ABZX12_17700 [Kribbella sp. NPDC003505]|uniref:hypothetical protein n=1 Tax=Kribbella sp. NPDC003505 TaxID=3154448 RepID=UPI0033B11995